MDISETGAEDFPKECSLSLTRGEAEYLAERIRVSPDCSGSLLAALVAQRQRHDEVPFAWQGSALRQAAAATE
jgi:hypothetical protein